MRVDKHGEGGERGTGRVRRKRMRVGEQGEGGGRG